ncbi:hypothetical protein KPH14_008201 [Odynerus spinipes]|uniref:HIT-type domain-containing protein n=1 Tax=Odynerus spinipes TaxID=1348599 RepID=A0AAD9RGG0_9HYME|nr:hypothetical protein KPH14_008201 [Odynerus spinipes]
MDRMNAKEVEYCKLCNKKPKSYTCPRCGIGYCNLDCYKSEVHLECSESFYKQCVEEELKSSESDPEARRKMIEILKRVHEGDIENDMSMESEDEEELDSDDEANLLDLETRLKDIDLDNPDQVWAILSDAEKQEFEALVKSGEAYKLLPPWLPWWTIHKKPLIESLDITEEEKHDKHETEYPVIIDVQPFNEQMMISPKIRFNIMNVIYAYTYIALYYNGDYLNCAEEAANTFLSICENMKENKIFDNEEDALESVVQNIKQNEHLSKDVETLSAFAEAGNSILRNPSKMQGTIHTCAALSELWRLLSEAQKEMTVNKHKKEKQLSTKHIQHNKKQNICLSKKIIFACLKKLEFYISWLKTYGKDMYT